MREMARRYNYREIRVPLVEHTELFARGVGEATDIVSKEMYTFEDRGGRSLTLRPEGTASVARAYLTHGWQTSAPFQKLFYLGPMFRYEKPQKGRNRQFHQYGIEVLGALDPSVDVEVLAFAWSLIEHLGLGGLQLRLNSIGCADDRAAYRDILRQHFAPAIDRMCADCRRRLDENPLRILDCKEAQCQTFLAAAPGSADHLCPDCAEHFARVREGLDRLGLALRHRPAARPRPRLLHAHGVRARVRRPRVAGHADRRRALRRSDRDARRSADARDRIRRRFRAARARAPESADPTRSRPSGSTSSSRRSAKRAAAPA